jgi:glycosyltransferase involved in cell wall biosynthesis
MSKPQTEKQKKILLIINNYELNSINKIVLKIIETNQDLLFYILSLEDFGEYQDDFSDKKNTILIKKGKNLLQKIIKAKKLIIQQKIKIIHTHSLRPELCAFYFKIFSPRLFLISNRHNPLFLQFNIKSRLQNIAYRLFSHYTNQNICVAPHIYQTLSKNFKIPQKKLLLIENALLENKQFKKGVKKIKTKQIIYFGQLIKRKNLEVLILAWAQIKNAPQLTIMGRGKELEKLKLLASKHCAKSKKEVVFLPFHPNPENFYKKGDIFVLSSLNEGLSLSLLESMKNSLICVASNIPANKFVIKHNCNGLLFQAGSIQSLKKQLLRLINNPQLSKKLINQAHKDVKKYFKNKKMTEAYRTNYQILFQLIDSK